MSDDQARRSRDAERRLIAAVEAARWEFAKARPGKSWCRLSDEEWRAIFAAIDEASAREPGPHHHEYVGSRCFLCGSESIAPDTYTRSEHGS